MPNWVQNDLAIEGNAVEISNCVLFLESGTHSGSRLDFSQVIKIPDELLNSELHTYGGDRETAKRRNDLREKMKSKYGFYNSIDFCIENWGTKWNACDVEFGGVQPENDQCVAIYKFKTAWSIPHQVISKLSEKYPALKFTIYSTEEFDNFDPVCVEYRNGIAKSRPFVRDEF